MTRKWPNVEAFDTEHAEADARRASDFEPMTHSDFSNEFGTAIANQRKETPAERAERQRAARERRQEFNRRMGEFASDFRDSAAVAAQGSSTIGEILPPQHAEYISLLAEQERRFGNRRWARSIALAEAHEQLSREAMIFVAEKYFSNKVTPAGYACAPHNDRAARSVCLLLSDLHLGSELDSLDEPVTFNATQEARRLEYILRQFIDYKPQYRAHSEALLIFNGDMIEGMLLHDLRSGAPLTEQKAIFWSYMRAFIANIAQHFPSVRIVCQPGNHGRDKVRHPGRATSRKWDGHEFEMYIALKAMCLDLKNVAWQIDFRAVSLVNLYGSTLGVTHGDTEVKLGDPDAKARENARTLDRINSTHIYGAEIDAWVFGHYHKPRYIPGIPKVLWNGALVPPNGYARSAGYIGEPTGQWMWEAVEGYPIGDVRFIEVGASQDNDEKLGSIIQPFRFIE